RRLHGETYVYPTPSRLVHVELTDEDRQVLVDTYNGGCLPDVDDLPYTGEMERIHREFLRRTGSLVPIRDLFRGLKELGRQGRLGGTHGGGRPAAGGPPAPAENATQGAGAGVS